MMMEYMLSINAVARMSAQRGPRWMISARVRKGEYCATYADTAKHAEELHTELERESYRDIRVTAPDGGIDLASLGRARRDAQATLDEATAILRAGVLRALEDNREEAEIARTAHVDRQTVRAWAGKQPMNRN